MYMLATTIMVFFLKVFRDEASGLILGHERKEKTSKIIPFFFQFLNSLISLIPVYLD